MEKMINKHYRKRFFILWLGFFTGSILYGLLGNGENAFYRVMASTVATIIFLIIFEFNSFKKRPDLKEVMKIEDKDERTQLVRAKAGSFSFTVALVTLTAIFFIGIFIEDSLIVRGTAVLTLFLISINMLAVRYWNKRM